MMVEILNEGNLVEGTSQKPSTPAIDHEDTNFSYDGYQVVRGEFFAHLFEPSVTLSREKVSVNTACLRKLPDTDYVQFLVNPNEKKLAIKPCEEDMKDSFRWSSGDGKKRKPKSITCRIFFAKVMNLMGWDPQYRYKILGKLIRAKKELLFVFDLSSAEVYGIRSNGEKSASRTPIYPEAWKNQFGVPFNEHQDTVQVSIFEDYAVFKINRDDETKGKRHVSYERNDPSVSSGSEETKDSDS